MSILTGFNVTSREKRKNIKIYNLIKSLFYRNIFKSFIINDDDT